MQSLRYMLNEYDTLRTLSLIAEESTKPTQYLCTPREMILKSTSDWDKINNDLKTLAEKSFVQITRADTIRFSITSQGIAKLHALEGKPLPK
jgi:hypothetical protein